MDKVRVVLLGLGNFGRSWAISILPKCEEFVQVVGIVDQDETKWVGIADAIPKYRDLESALKEARPELVINVTPPYLHYEINRMLLQNNVAVLCEKPLADTMENAYKTGEILKATDGFLMISQNYRYHPLFRRAGEMLRSGELGRIRQMKCHFSHYHPDASGSYHGKLEHPLLSDVAIHHMDLARYLCGENPIRVWCKEEEAPYCWYGRRPATATLVAEMTGDIFFRYDGSLAARVSTTDWNGDWEIVCEEGTMVISQGHIMLHTPTEDEWNARIQDIEIAGEEADSRVGALREACEAIREGRKGETDYADNVKTFTWVKSAIQSAETSQWVDVE